MCTYGSSTLHQHIRTNKGQGTPGESNTCDASTLQASELHTHSCAVKRIVQISRQSNLHNLE
jgi:hypothetical protein